MERVVLFYPHIPKDAPLKVAATLRTRWIGQGPKVDQFERYFSKSLANNSPCIAVGSGTDALHLAYILAGIKPGDEVITPVFTCTATNIPLLYLGAKIKFADVDVDTLNIDIDHVNALISEKTKAIICVHYGGLPCDMDGLIKLSEKYQIPIIQDSAHAIGAKFKNKHVGTFGDTGCFSFYPTKNLGAIGDGGIVGTNDTVLADKIRCLRNGGQSLPNHHESMGVNSRLDEIQAAVLRAKLPFLRQWTERRRSLAAFYRTNLNETSVRIPAEVDAGHVYHLFPVHSTERNRLQEYLKSNGIYTLIHYPTPIPQQPAFATYKVDCPTANRLCNELLSLPLHPNLTDSEIQLVALTVSRFMPTSV